MKDEFQHYKADLALMGTENERLQQDLRDARAKLRGASGHMESVRDDQALQVQALRQSLRALNEQLLLVTTERDDAQRAHAAILLDSQSPNNAINNSSSASNNRNSNNASPAPSLDGARLAAELAELRLSDAGLKAELARLAARLADADDKIAAARAKADTRVADVQAEADKRVLDAEAAADALVRAASDRAASASAREAATVRALDECRTRLREAEEATAVALQRAEALAVTVGERTKELAAAADRERSLKGFSDRVTGVADANERARAAAEVSAADARKEALRATAAMNDAKALADAALRDRDDAIARALTTSTALDAERARSASFEAAANDAAVLKADRDMHAAAVRAAEQRCAQLEAEGAAANDALAAMASQVERLTLRSAAVGTPPAHQMRGAARSERTPPSRPAGAGVNASRSARTPTATKTPSKGWFSGKSS